MKPHAGLRVLPALCILSTTFWLVTATISAQAQTFSLIHSFAGGPADGAYPIAPLLRDSKASLYAAASSGGSFGWGAVVKITPGGDESVLYNFQDAADGLSPFLSFVESNTIFGTTYEGGLNLFGTVFKLDAKGQLTILYSCCTRFGAFPGGVIRDPNGDLYGITLVGGDGDCALTGCGTVFKLGSENSATFIHIFGKVAGDGQFPDRSLVRDASGNIYGTTVYGGTYDYGTIFKIAPGGHETIIYSFRGGADGAFPWGGVRRDAQGNLYGTTSNGGSQNDGTVFKISNSGEHLILHSFTGTDGLFPIGGVALDDSGTIFGVTYEGGRHNKGTAFKLDASRNLTVLHDFDGVGDGEYPEGVLLANGSLYGVTYQGGAYNYGTIFKLTP